MARQIAKKLFFLSIAIFFVLVSSSAFCSESQKVKKRVSALFGPQGNGLYWSFENEKALAENFRRLGEKAKKKRLWAEELKKREEVRRKKAVKPIEDPKIIKHLKKVKRKIKREKLNAELRMVLLCGTCDVEQ